MGVYRARFHYAWTLVPGRPPSDRHCKLQRRLGGHHNRRPQEKLHRVPGRGGQVRVGVL